MTNGSDHKEMSSRALKQFTYRYKQLSSVSEQLDCARLKLMILSSVVIFLITKNFHVF